MVDTVPAAALDDHDARVGQDAQVLHDREPAQLWQLAGQGTGRRRRVPEQISHRRRRRRRASENKTWRAVSCCAAGRCPSCNMELL